MSLPGKTRFDPSFALVDKDGRPTQQFRDYMRALDALVGALSALGNNTLTNIGASGTLAANNGNAAAAGVPVGALYCDSSGFVHVRTA